MRSPGCIGHAVMAIGARCDIRAEEQDYIQQILERQHIASTFYGGVRNVLDIIYLKYYYLCITNLYYYSNYYIIIALFFNIASPPFCPFMKYVPSLICPFSGEMYYCKPLSSKPNPILLQRNTCTLIRLILLLYLAFTEFCALSSNPFILDLYLQTTNIPYLFHIFCCICCSFLYSCINIFCNVI